jgi:Fibronectin type III domain
MKNGVLGALLLSTFLSARMPAATHTAASCSQSHVQTAINSAVTGDTVTIPAGTCAWTDGVSTSNKAVTITGQGAGRIIAYTPDSLTVGTGTKTVTIHHSWSSTAISVGQTLRLSRMASRGNWMQGTVTSYSNGVLTMNITSTGGSGAAVRWLVSTIPTTTIVNNASGSLFNISEATSGHVRISGIKVAAGTGDAIAFSIRYTEDGRAVVIRDCWVEQPMNFGGAVWSNTNRGVIANSSFDSSPWADAPLAFHFQPNGRNTSWTTRSTMGADDTTGENNFYLENNDFHAYNNATDIDSNGRAVARYNVFNHAGFGTHGPDTSLQGQRHFEYYNNTGLFNAYPQTGVTFGLNWWLYIRGGTFVVANNVLPHINSQDYPNKRDLNITVMNLQRNAGPNPCWGAGTSGGAMYFSPRQVGFGFVTGAGRDKLGRTNDSVLYVGDSEPAYIWGNKRPGGSAMALTVGFSDYGECSNPDRTSNYVVEGRDYFNSPSMVKPGWIPYTYPHPLVAGASSPAPAPSPADTTAPTPPGSPSTAATSSSQITLSWSPSTDNVGVTSYRVERCQGSSCTTFTQISSLTDTSFSDSGLSAGSLYQYRVRAADAAGNLSTYSSIASATAQSTAETISNAMPSGNSGIAAAYPGDVNIRSHPAVIFADDFESYSSVSQLTNNWSQLYHSQHTRIATEPANVFSGTRSLEFRVPRQSGEVSNEAVKNLSPAEDTIYIRVYTKFEDGYSAFGSSHNGLSIRAQYCCAGVPANGTNKFQVGLENSHADSSEPNPGYTKLYIYHPEQRSQWGDFWYPDGTVLPNSSSPGNFGPDFIPRPNFTPALNRWYSYELMVKANTPGQRDGRVAVWIDGNLVADHPNVRLRDVSSLKIDKAVLSLHIGSNTIRQNLKWYDNVVIARSYIGPMSKSSSAPLPPTNLRTTVQ